MKKSSSLIPVHMIHLPTVHVCTKFQSSRPHSCGEKCDEKFSFERLRNHRMSDYDKVTEEQGKSSTAPTFSKRDYNKDRTEQSLCEWLMAFCDKFAVFTLIIAPL